jgi:hypothetical protein
MICTISSATIEFKMTTTIDFRTMPINVPSICIPRVFPNIDERRIRGIIDSLKMGEIARVDIVRKQTDKGEKYNRVFIHWRRWNDSENANKSRERLLNGKEIKIIYDDPWFWKISAYREATSRPATRPLSNHPRLEFDSDERSEIRKSQRPDDRRPQQQRDYRRPQQQRDYNRRPQQQQRDYNRRPQGPQRPQREERKPEVKTFDPSTPNSSPPRSERPDTTSDVYYGDEEREVVMQTTVPEPVILDYSGLPPPPKRLSFKPKKTIVVEEKDN